MIRAPLILLLCFSLPANAFRSTDVESYTDPDYIGFQPKKIVLMVESTGIELRLEIEERVARRLQREDVEVVLYNDLLPPTRDWSAQARIDAFSNAGIDSALIISTEARATSIMPIGTQTYSNANAAVYGNTGTVSGTSSTYTVLSAKSSAEFTVALYDIKNENIIWQANIFTKAGGTLFVNARGDANGAARGIIKGLKEDGHIDK